MVPSHNPCCKMTVRKEEGTEFPVFPEFPVLWSFTQVKNIWLGCCATGLFKTVWRQPEVPFICIRPIPLSCALRNSAFGLRVRDLQNYRHTYIYIHAMIKFSKCNLTKITQASMFSLPRNKNLRLQRVCAEGIDIPSSPLHFVQYTILQLCA